MKDKDGKWVVAEMRLKPVGISEKTGATKYIEVDRNGKQVGRPFWHVKLKAA